MTKRSIGIVVLILFFGTMLGTLLGEFDSMVGRDESAASRT